MASRAALSVIDAYGHPTSGVQSLTFSPDGRRLASRSTWAFTSSYGPDGRMRQNVVRDPIRIWSIDDSALVRSFEGPFGAVSDLAWSADGRILASASRDKAACLWTVGDPEATTATVAEFSRAAFAVAFAPDGKRLAAAGGEAVVIADIGP